MNIDLKGKTAIVTGASGGIGQAICRKYIAAGANIVAVDVRREQGEEFVEELVSEGSSAVFIEGDVSDKQSMQNMCRQVLEEYGKIDILVNNAGVNVKKEGRKKIHEFSDDEWKRIINIDLGGVFYCSKPVIHNMIENGGGRIVNISSVVGQVPFRNQCAFAAAKAGVIHLTKVMAIELAEFGILVNCICPGSTMVPSLKKLWFSDKETAEKQLSHIPLHRVADPEEIAGTVVFATSNESSYMTGSILTIDGGWTSGYARDF